MSNMEHRGNKVSENNKIIESGTDIEGEFSDFDRVFYQQDNISNQELLLLFSEKKQLFVNLNLKSHQISELDIKADKKYQQVEFYDDKLFCINRESLTMDIFFSSKKQMLYHKKIISFTNKELKLREHFRLVIWKQQESGILYRCLLGPLEDGRYMYFDLFERYFDNNSNISLQIGKVIFIRLAVDFDNNVPDNVICAVDTAMRSIICFDEREHNFFEYNNFSGTDSRYLEVITNGKIQKKKLRHMYFYYPYDFFTRKEKNQLQAAARNMGIESNLENFIRNRYKEVLLCMEGDSLLKIDLMDTAVSASIDTVWQVDYVNINRTYIPVDVAINENTGEIYCLCEQEIIVLENSNRMPNISNGQDITKKMSYYDPSANS